MDEILMDEVSILGIFMNFDHPYVIHKDFDS